MGPSYIQRRGTQVDAEDLSWRRQQTASDFRAIMRDGEAAFVGSQSLRPLELDGRREVGLIVKEPKTVRRLLEVFEDDWARTDLGQRGGKHFKKEVRMKKGSTELAEAASR